MARLQVLHLSSTPDGAARYALVADQAGDLPEPDREALRAFATEAGAQGAVVLSGTVELGQGDDERDDELAQQLGDLIRSTAAAPQAAGQQKPKLPPPNTTEGKLARMWGGTDPTEGADPQ